MSEFLYATAPLTSFFSMLSLGVWINARGMLKGKGRK